MPVSLQVVPLISIHALLAESDHQTNTGSNESGKFLSTLSLRRATSKNPVIGINKITFLSTLSLRRATVAPVLAVGRAGYFYPRSPCGERQANAVDQILPGHISIHALLAESDQGETHHEKSRTISIHALLAESDLSLCFMIHRL